MNFDSLFFAFLCGLTIWAWTYMYFKNKERKMSRDYPLPHYAANIWVAGDVIWLGFDGHNTHFPSSIKGLSLLLAVLKERSRGKVMIGSNGEPNQYQVERTLQQDKRWNELLRLMRGVDERATEREQKSEEFLKELGLL